ncbi:adenosylhomocysteinase [Candidatus Roizmanbacteria bacterium CG02_land_8_20_14_3_00_36_15]|uniref:Adenosylhomocysteinase n=2 Tax=Candidatus Roizmaniibacteriota TaxID=1752723 RepID=A0A2M8KL45_9BACT|nr:MAG: adenosylhomocysteinase [Candidatus Roizmanbacteria bacterium CG02_land_8_20_14_3_00_36_15]PIY70154.1 MAG: adenosylhomocysteinase [Candidatus Roizmanbacteria bacterium CG_4_10_14_0_8_um_filter_36_36]PJC82309.1 MAG: adenosylhomocysteinase [Candidatus Roizmanbacteria bacterium CG_4_8_14_3_um_filter_36_10]PJE60641.1 MAG: adenosylhomocysteinase [Candidatus Roizmanbacteria bacterium CG10_big_fil_rev_8_21_14_0_10_36_26]
MNYDVKDINLAPEGKKLIDWAEKQMPVLRLIRERFKKEKPLKGVKLGACLHVTSETANLVITLKAGGAEVFLSASNPLSTNDFVAASLVKDYQIPTFAIKGEDTKSYYKHLNSVLDYQPNFTMDDGADLVSLLHGKRKKQISSVVCSNEETTTGVIRLRAMEKARALKIPVIAVNDNLTKHLFDNRYGTGQSTIDGILRATNILLAGKNFIICGYGWCGRGLAMRARGMGAKVIICEIDPVKALEAHMDGYSVMELETAIKTADIAVTTTGDKHVIDKKHFLKAKDGIILANSGHFDIEINLAVLKKMAKKITKVRPMVEEYEIKIQNPKSKIQIKKIYILAEGRLVNLSAADGHPASVMDMSFAGQALAAEWGWENKEKLEKKVYSLPLKIDQQIARLKLRSEAITIDSLTIEQKRYLGSWKEGT